MPVDLLFNFSTGLGRDVAVPLGTVADCRRHVAGVGEALGLSVERYRDNPAHWSRPDWGSLDRVAACATVERHDAWVARLHADLVGWMGTPPEGPTEVMSPGDASGFWHGLATVAVEPWHWSDAYLAARVEEAGAIMRGERRRGVAWPGGGPVGPLTAAQVEDVLRILSPEGLSILVVPSEPATREAFVEVMREAYEVMRGRGEGLPEGAPRMREPLTAAQAGGVAWLVSVLGYDDHDVRLEVPLGYDELETGDDGGYEWCSTCGAILRDDAEGCRRRPCGFREEGGRAYDVEVSVEARYEKAVLVPERDLPPGLDVDGRATEAALEVGSRAFAAAGILTPGEGWTVTLGGEVYGIWRAGVRVLCDGEGAAYAVRVVGHATASRRVRVDALDERDAEGVAEAAAEGLDWPTEVDGWRLVGRPGPKAGEVAQAPGARLAAQGGRGP